MNQYRERKQQPHTMWVINQLDIIRHIDHRGPFDHYEATETCILFAHTNYTVDITGLFDKCAFYYSYI